MRCRELDIFKILGIFLDIVWKLFDFFESFWGIFWNFFGGIVFGQYQKNGQCVQPGENVKQKFNLSER